MALYRCPECEKVVERDSTALHIRSLCEEIGQIVLLIRLP